VAKNLLKNQDKKEEAEEEGRNNKDQ